MVILLRYTSAFSEVIYADFYAKILDWNFYLIDDNSQIWVVVFISKLNFSFSFCFVNENCRIFVVVFVMKINLFSLTNIFVFVVVDEKNTGMCVLAGMCIVCVMHVECWRVSYIRYDPDLARFEDPPSVVKPDDESAFKFCPSCVRVRQKQLVRFNTVLIF